MNYLFTAIWPVTDTALKLPGLVLVAEDDLAEMLDEQGATLTAEPTWVLSNGRLAATAPARRRAPWDSPEPAKAYFVDLLPDGVD